jgi:hypothetical protein
MFSTVMWCMTVGFCIYSIGKLLFAIAVNGFCLLVNSNGAKTKINHFAKLGKEENK